MDNSVEMKRMLEAATKAHPESFANFDRTKNIQDQLQEMVGDYLAQCNIIHEYLDCEVGGRLEALWDYTYTSMEQLWLAFVLKEKYGKVWTGENWVKMQ